MITEEKLNLLRQYTEKEDINIIYADLSGSGINGIYFSRNEKEFIVINESIKDTNIEVEELKAAIGTAIMCREKDYKMELIS